MEEKKNTLYFRIGQLSFQMNEINDIKIKHENKILYLKETLTKVFFL